jgi:hypothetical protein
LMPLPDRRIVRRTVFFTNRVVPGESGMQTYPPATNRLRTVTVPPGQH